MPDELALDPLPVVVALFEPEVDADPEPEIPPFALPVLPVDELDPWVDAAPEPEVPVSRFQCFRSPSSIPESKLIRCSRNWCRSFPWNRWKSLIPESWSIQSLTNSRSSQFPWSRWNLRCSLRLRS